MSSACQVASNMYHLEAEGPDWTQIHDQYLKVKISQIEILTSPP